MNVIYSYTYEVEENTFTENVEIEFTFGLNADNKMVVHPERLEGNLLYYKMVLGDIKTKCQGMIWSLCYLTLYPFFLIKTTPTSYQHQYSTRVTSIII